MVTPLSCSLDQQEIAVSLIPDSRLADLHGATKTRERTTCNYGLSPDFGFLASSGGLAIAATDATGEVRAVERPDHPFFIATLYQPQLTTAPGAAHPVFVGFLSALTA